MNKKMKVLFLSIAILICAAYFARTVYAWTLTRVVLCTPAPMAMFQRTDYLAGEVRFTDEYEGFTAATEFVMPAGYTASDIESIDPSRINIRMLIDKYVGAIFGATLVSVTTGEDGLVRLTLAYTPVRHEAYVDYEDIPLVVLDGDYITCTIRTLFPTDYVIPSAAIHRDGEGAFVHRIITKNGLLGRQFVVVRESVDIRAQHGGWTALWKDDSSDAAAPSVVLSADKPITAGQSVRLYP